MKMTIKEVLISALMELYEKDAELIQNGTNEDTLNGRLACYLRLILEDDIIKVDIEYNRHIDDVKYYGSEGKYAVVDIVVHQRRSDAYNLMAVECKREEISAGDIEKIKALVSPEYMYNIGATISYYQKEINFYKWDVDSKLITTEKIEL